MSDPVIPVIVPTKTQIIRRRALIAGGVVAGLLIAGVAVVLTRQPSDEEIEVMAENAEANGYDQ